MSTIRPDRDHLVDAALSTLDAAPAASLTPQEEARADATLERVVAAPVRADAPRRRSTRVTRVMLRAAAAAAQP